MKVLRNYLVRKFNADAQPGRIYLAFIVYATLVVDNILLTVVGKHFFKEQSLLGVLFLLI